MQRRRRVKQVTSFKDRLSSFAKEVREKALRLPPGVEREAMLRRASRADTAAHLDDWINSPGLQPPE
jgi:predicted trehalose synthase